MIHTIQGIVEAAAKAASSLWQRLTMSPLSKQ